MIKNELLHEVLCQMKYAFGSTITGDIVPNMEAWLGKGDPEGGIRSYIKSLFIEVEKAAFIAGFKAGGKAVFNDLVADLPNHRVVEYNEADASIGAEREYLKCR